MTAEVSVSLWPQEIGIRVAMGAEREAIIRMIVGNGVSLARIGMGIGVAAAFLLTRFVANLLYGASASDPLTLFKRRCRADCDGNARSLHSSAPRGESRSHGGAALRVIAHQHDSHEGQARTTLGPHPIRRSDAN